MGDKHVVRFEPVGIEIEVDEDQTVLRAAAEQGIMLMHGCKEGQCAACKSFVLDGEDIELDKYSTFALPDFEKEEGFTLLCRAHVYEDVTIELLNYDEDMIRSGHPIQEAVAEVVSNEPVTHDMRHLVLKLVEPDRARATSPGQYVDITVPGTDGRRSFSMANTPTGETRAARVRHQGLPGRPVLQVPRRRARGRRPARRRRPVRGLHPARGRDVRTWCSSAAAPGMAPILCAAALAGRARAAPARRPTTTAPARKQDLCFEKELHALEETLPNFRYVPALSEPDGDGLGRRGRPDHRRASSKHESDLPAPTPTSAGRRRWSRRRWTCSTPLGADEKRIYYDKFTTTGSILTHQHRRKRGGPDDDQHRYERSAPKPEFTDAEAGAKEFPDSTAAPLQLLHARRSASSPTTRTSPSRCSPTRGTTSRQGWLYGFSDGRGGYPLDWTALKAWGVDRPDPSASPAPAARATTGRRTAGTSSATRTRSGSSRSTATTPTSCGRSTRTSRPPARPRRSSSGTRNWVHLRRAQRRRLDARRARPRPLPVRQRPAARAHEHAQQRDLGEQHAPDPVRPGPGAVQPHAERGDRGLRRRRARGDVEQRPGLAGRPPRSPSS